MSTIGERLKEVRLDRGENQASFGALGGVGKRTQINYEKDERRPDSKYFALLAEEGIDVTYVLTGTRPEENERDAALEALAATLAVEPSGDGPLTKKLAAAFMSQEKVRRDREAEMKDMNRLLLALSDEDFELVMQVAIKVYRASLGK